MTIFVPLKLASEHTRLVAHVARTVAKPRGLDLGAHNLLGVAPCARHAVRRVQARRAHGSLVDLIQDYGVVLGVRDAADWLLFLTLRKARDLAPATHLRGLVGSGRPGARQPRRARRRRCGRRRE